MSPTGPAAANGANARQALLVSEATMDAQGYIPACGASVKSADAFEFLEVKGDVSEVELEGAEIELEGTTAELNLYENGASTETQHMSFLAELTQVLAERKRRLNRTRRIDWAQFD